MNSKERLPRPTGNFPSVEEESRLRFNFIDKKNPLLKYIRVKLKELGFGGKRHLPINVLAFYYGVYFYNQVSRRSLFAEDESYPLKIINNPHDSTLAYVRGNGIYLNLGSSQAKTELFVNPLEEIEPSDSLTLSMPSIFYQIISGIEEANHLHLDNLHQKHQPNPNGRSDHRIQNQLWRESGYDPIAYRAKLWHEFAALVVQRAYLNFYISAELPETAREFNQFYQDVIKMRRAWVRRKKSKH